MALANFSTIGIQYPRITHASSTGAQTAYVIDADGEKVGFSGYAPKAGVIDAVVIIMKAVTQAPTNGLKVSLQGLDTVGSVQGAPDGVIGQYRVIASGITAATNIETGLLTSDGTDLGTKRTVTQGEPLAVVIEYESFAAGDNVSLGSQIIASQTSMATLYTGSWARTAQRGASCLIKYSDGTYLPMDVSTIAHCYESLENVSTTNATTPDEIGVLFQVPFDCTLHGINYLLGTQGPHDIVAYNAASTAIATRSLATTELLENANGKITSTAYFETSVTISADTDYRITIKPSSGAAIILSSFLYGSNAFLAGDVGTSTFIKTERTDAGSWTDTNTTLPGIVLLLDAVDVGSSGGGSGSGRTIHIPYYRF